MSRAATINPRSLEYFHDALGGTQLPVLADMNRRPKRVAGRVRKNAETAVVINMGGVNYSVTGSAIYYKDGEKDAVVSYATNKSQYGQLISAMAGVNDENKKKLQSLNSPNVNEFITTGGEAVTQGLMQGFSLLDMFGFGKQASEETPPSQGGTSPMVSAGIGAGIGTAGVLAIGIGVVAVVGVGIYIATRK